MSGLSVIPKGELSSAALELLVALLPTEARVLTAQENEHKGGAWKVLHTSATLTGVDTAAEVDREALVELSQAGFLEVDDYSHLKFEGGSQVSRSVKLSAKAREHCALHAVALLTGEAPE